MMKIADNGSKISVEDLRKFADQDKNGKIENEEVSVFNALLDYAVEQKQVDEEDAKLWKENPNYETPQKTEDNKKKPNRNALTSIIVGAVIALGGTLLTAVLSRNSSGPRQYQIYYNIGDPQIVPNWE